MQKLLSRLHHRLEKGDLQVHSVWTEGKRIIEGVHSFVQLMLGLDTNNQNIVSDVNLINEDEEIKEGEKVDEVDYDLLYLSDQEKQLLKTLFPEGIENSHFSQSPNVGDCYLLATLHALKQNPIAPYIFVETISRGEDKWIVNFSNEDEFFIYDEELEGNGKIYRDPDTGKIISYAAVSGQLGDRLIELAYGKYRKRNHIGRASKKGSEMTYQIVRGGIPSEVHEVILKRYMFDSHDYKCCRQSEIIELLFREVKKIPDNFLLTVTTSHSDYLDDYYSKGKKNFVDPDFRFVCNHVWSIVDVDIENRTVTLANPHDTEKKVHEISYKELFEYFNRVYFGKIERCKFDDAATVKHRIFPGEFNKRLTGMEDNSFNEKGIVLNLANGNLIFCYQKDGELIVDLSEVLKRDSNRIRKIKPGKSLEIGREEFTNFKDGISKLHCNIRYWKEGVIFVQDFNSVFGTVVENGHYEELEDDDELNLGNVCMNNYGHRLNPEIPYVYDIQGKLTIALGDDHKLYCEVKGDKVILDFFELTGVRGGCFISVGQEFVFGRDNNLSKLSQQISREHVKIKNIGKGRVCIKDLNSTNGTKVGLVV
ncbi:FHA domain-containing protein [Patescibacteria group bacterium]